MVIDLFEHNRTAYEKVCTMLAARGKAAVVHPYRACEVLSVSYPRLPLLWQLILMWRRLFARRRHVSTIGYRPLSVNFSI